MAVGSVAVGVGGRTAGVVNDDPARGPIVWTRTLAQTQIGHGGLHVAVHDRSGSARSRRARRLGLKKKRL